MAGGGAELDAERIHDAIPGDSQRPGALARPRLGQCSGMIPEAEGMLRPRAICTTDSGDE
jgi:hypothetical protein